MAFAATLTESDFTARPRIIGGMAKKSDTEIPVWEISRLKKTLVLGRIPAPNAEKAIEDWAEKYGITDKEQKSRLAARRVK